MVCKKCGIELQEGVNFCPVCGQYNEDEQVILQRAQNVGKGDSKKKMIRIVFSAKAMKSRYYKAVSIICLIVSILCIVASAINSILGMILMLEQMGGSM